MQTLTMDNLDVFFIHRLLLYIMTTLLNIEVGWTLALNLSPMRGPGRRTQLALLVLLTDYKLACSFANKTLDTYANN